MCAGNSVTEIEGTNSRSGRDGSSASHLAANDFCDAVDLAANPDPEPVEIVVAAIAIVAVDSADSNNL